MIPPDDDLDAPHGSGSTPFYFTARNGRSYVVTWCPVPTEGGSNARRFRRCFVIEQVDERERASLAARDAATTSLVDRPPLDTSGRVLAGIVRHDPPGAVYEPLGVATDVEGEACEHLLARAATLARIATGGGGPFSFVFWGVEYDVTWRRGRSGAYVVTRGGFAMHGSIAAGPRPGTYVASGVNSHVEFHVIGLLKQRQRERERAQVAMNRQNNKSPKGAK